MLTKKITEKELKFMEDWHDPVCLTECLFSNFDNLSEFDEEKYGELRLYQFPFLSYEPIIDEEVGELYDEWKDLSKGERRKKEFALRKGAGDVISLGARKYGKTLCTEKLDIPLSMLYDDGWWTALSSIDAIHLRGVLDAIKPAIENHPILKLWKLRIRTAHPYKIEARNGWFLDGINMNLQSKNPGHQFYGKHVKKLWIEEQSFEPEKVYNKRQDALSELGAVIRLSGMTNFTKHSPAGKIYYDLKNQSKIVNLPQFVNPYWDEEERKSRLKEYGGEDSIGYRVFVKGEVVEEGVSEFDMERIRPCYQEKKEIKRFEIKKERFERFKSFIVVDRPTNAERIFICADIGESAGTEIIILSEVGEKYNYLYNIVLYNLAHDEQVEVFTWLISKLEANIVGIDCGDGTGRAIYRSLEKIFNKENLVWYAGMEKINVGFEKDEKNKVKIQKGQPVYQREFMSEWSIRRLKVLLYEERCNLPLDYKFDTQFNSVMSTQSGTRRIYVCVSESGDHLFDAWRVFSIAQWLKKDFKLTKPMRKKRGTGVSNWTKDETESSTK